MEYLMPAHSSHRGLGGRGRRLARLDHSDDPTGSVWIRLDRRRLQRGRPDPSGADQTDAEHQAMDLAVV